MDYLCYRLNEVLKLALDVSVLTQEERELPLSRRMARALLRHEIARRVGIAAADVCFTQNEHGKPLTQGVHFNISHSGDYLCMAFHHAPIGVDIQQKRGNALISKLAPRIMGAEQLQRFRSQGEPAEVFFTCWSIAESLVKLHGDTIWKALDYPFVLNHGRVDVMGDTSIAVELFQPHSDYCGAVAYRLSS